MSEHAATGQGGGLGASPAAPRLVALGAAIAVAVIALDQLTKWWVLQTPALRALDCLANNRWCGAIEVSGIFDLTMHWNRGVSFGLLASDSGLMVLALIAVAVGLSVAMAVWLWRTGRLFTAIGLGFIIGGALGNVIDRALYGAVVDFLDFSGLYFPFIFNVADAAINVGVAALILDWVLEERGRRATAGPPSSTSQ